MSSKIILPVVAIMGAIVVASIVPPIFPTSTQKEAFRINDFDVKSGYFTWRDFTMVKGSTIKIIFISDREVNIFLFTENQYTNFKNAGDDTCIDSIKYVKEGTINQVVDASGKYYFVVSNRSDRTAEIVRAEGDIYPKRVTLLQKMTGNW